MEEQHGPEGLGERNTHPKLPTKIHLIDGEKGGVGKSLFARVMMHYCRTNNKSVVLVDSDATNPDVLEVYGGKKITFSEDERKSYAADEIFDLAFEQSVVVNLPAQTYYLVSQWIQRNNLLELGKQYDIQFVKWFVCNGAYDSVKLFLESVEKFKTDMTHVLVENYYSCDEWSQVYERPGLKQAIEDCQIKSIQFPKLSYQERDRILEHKLTFADAVQHKDMKILGQQRVVNFLKQALAEIDKTGLVLS